MWAQFEALARVPVLVIRGGNSDILSAETVAAMKKRLPTMEVIEVPDQGHVPALAGTDLLCGIAAFVTKCDVASRRSALETVGADQPAVLVQPRG
jgi:pimeloyl-ACP methyl ester carboxylesterase